MKRYFNWICLVLREVPNDIAIDFAAEESVKTSIEAFEAKPASIRKVRTCSDSEVPDPMPYNSLSAEDSAIMDWVLEMKCTGVPSK